MRDEGLERLAANFRDATRFQLVFFECVFRACIRIFVQPGLTLVY